MNQITLEVYHFIRKENNILQSKVVDHFISKFPDRNNARVTISRVVNRLKEDSKIVVTQVPNTKSGFMPMNMIKIKN